VSEDRSSHVAAPLSSLRDPASFAPPPKRDPSQPLPPPPTTTTPARAPVQSAGPQANLTTPIHQQEGVTEPAPTRAKGWQLDTTGLSTSHLPPPPGRTGGVGASSPTSGGAAAPPPYSALKSQAPKPAPPSLPPRLPPRSGTSSPVRAGSPASTPRPAAPTQLEARTRTENGVLNQGAVNRLQAAGISVPGFGIGSQTSPTPPPRSPSSPAQGTTWQQEQAALKTATQLQNDPSSVSLADARSAATTANNFRQRHGEQVTDGLRTAKNLNRKFGAPEQVGASDNITSGPGSEAARQPSSPSGALSVKDLASALGKKKPPAPPPPKKKAELSTPSRASDVAKAPPPVPMSTRPTF
jgi:hypothetical protein